MRDETQSIRKVFVDLLETVGLVVTHTQFSIHDLMSKTVNKREFWNLSYEVAWRSISTVIITTMSIGMVSSLQLTKHFATFGAISEIGGANALALVRELSHSL